MYGNHKIIDKYINFNNTFKKRHIFNLGSEAGFFSEYNNMILCMLYCLKNRIRFELYSANAFFRYDKGWSDYFLPFCNETFDKWHKKFNRRQEPPKKKLYRLLGKFHKKVHKIHYYTFELWWNYHCHAFEKEVFQIPELNINGDLRHAAQILIDLTWKYNDTVESEITEIVSSLNLPKEYADFHIRGGDKIIEHNLYQVDAYIKKAREHSDFKNAFVLTDDYRMFESLCQKYPDINFFTLCDKNAEGYNHLNFCESDSRQIRTAHINLFASIDILANAGFFVGSFSSNPGMYLGMRMDRDKCFGVDLPKW